MSVRIQRNKAKPNIYSPVNTKKKIRTQKKLTKKTTKKISVKESVPYMKNSAPETQPILEDPYIEIDSSVTKDS